MLRFLETVWLIIAVFGIMVTAYSFFPGAGFEEYDRYWFLGISIVAIIMFFVRRNQRKMRERSL